MKGSRQYRSLAGILVIAALLLTGCPRPGAQPVAQATAVQPAPTQAHALPPTNTVPAVTLAPAPTSASMPTPVPIATWIAQGIPSDLVITYEYQNHHFPDEASSIRIAGDGNATHECCTRDFPQRYAGKLSPEVLRRILMAFGETRFFYMEIDPDGCKYDIVTPTPFHEEYGRRVTSKERTAGLVNYRAISITINGISKTVGTAEGCWYIEGDDSDRVSANFDSLGRVIQEAVKDLPPVYPIQHDLRVRRAIAHCLDRRALIASVYPYIEDPDALLMDSFLPRDHWAYGGPYADMPQYDPEAGKALLEEAGWTLPAGAAVRRNADGEPLSLKFTTTDAQYRQTWGAVFVQNMAACGIEIEPNYVPATWWFGDTTGLARRDFELGAFAWVGEPDPKGRTLYACDQIPLRGNYWVGQNYMGWCNETASAAIITATNTLLRAERMAAYDVVQQEFARDVVSIPLFQRVEVAAWRADLTGPHPDPTEYATANLHEWKRKDGGDTVVIGLTQEPDSLWAANSSSTASALVRMATGSGRTYTQYTYDFQPGLQEALSTIESGLASNNAVEVKAGDKIYDAFGEAIVLEKRDKVLDKDGKEVQFDGVTPVTMKQLVVTYKFKPFTWSDGAPGVIADFQLGQKIDCDPFYGDACESIQEVTWAAEGLEYTVIYLPGVQPPTYFLAPFAPYASTQIISDGRMLADVPAKEWGSLPELNESPLSWGPYRVVAWEKGQSITLERNPYYAGEVATPNVRFVFLEDAAQAVAQLISGKVHFLDESTLGADPAVQTVIDAARATGAIRYSLSASADWEHIDINLDAK